MYPNDTTNDIPYGYCKCGCGQKTSIAKRNDPAKGWVKGQPVQYIQYHLGQQFPPLVPPNPSGLCMCGCGKPTLIASKSNRGSGNVSGQPRRYIKGHGGRAPMNERFWRHVIKGGPDECWLWTAAIRQGYGAVSRGDNTGEIIGAHVASWELHNGPIPDGLCVLHNCPGGDNRRCVNPAHLWLGTKGENIQDWREKGKSPVHYDP